MLDRSVISLAPEGAVGCLLGFEHGGDAHGFCQRSFFTLQGQFWKPGSAAPKPCEFGSEKRSVVQFQRRVSQEKISLILG